MTFTLGLWIGSVAGIAITLAAIKLGDWLAWRTIVTHVLDALDADSAASDPDDDAATDDLDARTLDAMHVYLDALDRQQRARQALKQAH